MDLLGREFSDAELLSIGFAFEQSARFRRAPFSTPALVGGKAPSPSQLATAIGVFDYYPLTGLLVYTPDLERLTTGHVTAIWIHRGDEQKPGPAIHQLFAASGAGLARAVTLSNVDRDALRDGKLFVRVYSAQGIGAIQNFKLTFPAR